MTLDLFEQTRTCAAAVHKRDSGAVFVHPADTEKHSIAFLLGLNQTKRQNLPSAGAVYVCGEPLGRPFCSGGRQESASVTFCSCPRRLLRRKEEFDPDAGHLILYGLCRPTVHTAVRQDTIYNERRLDRICNIVNGLFNGYIAGEITLGEAIVRGLLHVQKYLLADAGDRAERKRCAGRAYSPHPAAVLCTGSSLQSAGAGWNRRTPEGFSARLLPFWKPGWSGQPDAAASDTDKTHIPRQQVPLLRQKNIPRQRTKSAGHAVHFHQRGLSFYYCKTEQAVLQEKAQVLEECGITNTNRGRCVRCIRSKQRVG